MFIDLVQNTRRSIIIHDDGNNSMYNRADVLFAVEQQIKKYPKLQIKCWFKYKEDIRFLELADGQFRKNFEIWHSTCSRPDDDVHYKIVDEGRLVHLSRHAQGAREREYMLRRAEMRFARGTRKRISEAYVAHFERGLTQAELRHT